MKHLKCVGTSIVSDLVEQKQEIYDLYMKIFWEVDNLKILEHSFGSPTNFPSIETFEWAYRMVISRRFEIGKPNSNFKEELLVIDACMCNHSHSANTTFRISTRKYVELVTICEVPENSEIFINYG